jgi:hypothetical protein
MLTRNLRFERYVGVESSDINAAVGGGWFDARGEE